jgi:hypothetical protein
MRILLVMIKEKQVLLVQRHHHLPRLMLLILILIFITYTVLWGWLLKYQMISFFINYIYIGRKRITFTFSIIVFNTFNRDTYRFRQNARYIQWVGVLSQLLMALVPDQSTILKEILVVFIINNVHIKPF